MTLKRQFIAWILIWAITIVGLRVTLLGAEECPTVSVDQIHQSVLASADWIVNNQDDDGRYLYEWNRSTGTASNDYNLVRHAGTTMALYQLIAEGESQYLEGADLGLDWMLERLFVVERPEGNVAAVAPGAQRGKLGTAALLTVGLVHRRQATGDTQYDQILQDAGRFMEAMWQDNGSMLSFWDQSTDAPVPELTSLFATGEAMWAFALLHKEFPEFGWDRQALGTLQYLATDRDDDEDVFPRPWADQWAAYGLNEMAGWDLNETQIEYARAIAAQFGVAVRWESQRNGWAGEFVHGPLPLAAGQGTWLEALGMLQEFSGKDSRMSDLEEDLGDRLLCGAGRMVERQVRGTGVVEHDGAWFTDDLARVDGQQHALSGLMFAERLLRDREENS